MSLRMPRRSRSPVNGSGNEALRRALPQPFAGQLKRARIFCDIAQEILSVLGILNSRRSREEFSLSLLNGSAGGDVITGRE